jgi:hypothetical protein
MNLNNTNHFDDNDLCIIYEDALAYVSNEVRSCYPSIFNEKIYQSVIKNLTDITNDLSDKGVISDEIHEYIMDYLNHSNNFGTWKTICTKCVYILCNYITLVRNDNELTF